MEPKKVRKVLILFLILSLALTGCAKKEKKSSYSLKEIYSEDAYGFFVKDGSQFIPVKFINKDKTEGFQWCVGTPNCPKVTEKTPLVAVFETNGDMPKEYYIDHYDSLGFTVGANVLIGEDENSLWFDTTNACSGSEAANLFSAMGFDGQVEIETVNKQVPLSNIDTDVNILTGLEKDKYYEFSLFVGTQHKTGPISADTMVLKRVGHTDLPQPFRKTDNQYFVVNLPDNIVPGYYDINGEGLFKI